MKGETMIFPKHFDKSRKLVCVQGLGFVGAAMSLAIAQARAESGGPLYNVIGIDLPGEAGEKKAEALNSGEFPFESSDRKLIRAAKQARTEGNLFAVTDAAYFQFADIVVVDINLDVAYRGDGEPYLDLDMFRAAIRTLGRTIREETLVVVETTVPPGTCEKVVRPILREEFAKRGMDPARIYVAHSYERVMPGENYLDSIVNYWRVYSGVDQASADRCEAFLKSVIFTENYPLTRLGSTTASEIAKVLENSYRAATIAFIEEWGRFAEAVGVDLFEVIDAIRMRPTHSNMRQPGFGVGGYCLTKDPHFARLAAKDLFHLEGMDFPFSSMAVRVNQAMPLVSLNKIEEQLGGSVEGKKILVCGVSYRQDVADTRYSPTETFAREAENRKAMLSFQDPLVGHWREMGLDVERSVPEMTGYDAIVFAVQHKQYLEIDFHSAAIDAGTLIFDANRVLSEEQRKAIRERPELRLSGIGR